MLFCVSGGFLFHGLLPLNAVCRLLGDIVVYFAFQPADGLTAVCQFERVGHIGSWRRFLGSKRYQSVLTEMPSRLITSSWRKIVFALIQSLSARLGVVGIWLHFFKKF